MLISLLKKQAANFITFSSLIFGLLSILSSIEDNYMFAVIYICVAAIFDFFDGFVARKLKTVSLFGKYLDSNSDLISFGVAPGLLIYLSVLKSFGMIGIIVSFLFIAGGAFRLARYNAVKFTGYYEGIPITIAGALLALSTLALAHVPSFLFLFSTLILSYLMVSTHSFKKV